MDPTPVQLLILEYVKKNPTASFAEIAEGCGLPDRSSAYYHVNILASAGRLYRTEAQKAEWVVERPTL